MFSKKMMAKKRMQDIAQLHYITQESTGFTHQESALKALKGGVKWVQLRVKDKSENEVLEVAKEVKKLCADFGAKLIINDFLEIAKELDLDGIHLGMTDTSTKVARNVLGDSKIIGGTANTLEDILFHYNNGVDYVGVGPYRFTSTKDNLSPVLGLEGFKNIIQSLKQQAVDLPVIAIGGIDTQDFKAIFDAGIHGVAIASLINMNANPEEKAKNILNHLPTNNL